MKNENIFLAANLLFRNRLNKTGLNKLPENLIPKTLIDAYKIQNELKILYLTLKDNITIGKKVGCTNLFAQKQLNISEPFYGNLFSKYSQINGCKLKSKDFYKPFVEPEISFVLKEDININKAPFTIDDSNMLFSKMFPSIELVDFRFGDNIKEIGILNLISTNGASEYYIKNDKTFLLNDIDLNDEKVTLTMNGEIMDEGNTNLVLNNPLNSAIWLINKLAFKGEPMLKGQYISTGTCTKAIPLKKNVQVKAFFGKLGSIEFLYT